MCQWAMSLYCPPGGWPLLDIITCHSHSLSPPGLCEIALCPGDESWHAWHPSRAAWHLSQETIYTHIINCPSHSLLGSTQEERWMLPILQRGDNANVSVVMIRSSEEQLILCFKERINDRAKRVSFLEFLKQIIPPRVDTSPWQLMIYCRH